MAEPTFDWTVLLPAATGDVVDLLGKADLGAPVPACPDWSVTALVGHLGFIHAWATGAVRGGGPDAGPPEVTSEPAPDDPRERERLTSWYAARADALVAALSEAGPDAPCWGFGPRPRTTAFWWRRQTHETLMHAWDVRAAQAGDPPPTVSEDPQLAVDGIDEAVRMFFPRQVRLERCAPLDRSLRLVPTDVEGVEDRWGPLGLAGDGTGEPPAAYDAELAGPADVLLLLLWGRTHLGDDRLAVTGDHQAVEQVLARPLVP